ncbi:MAG: hypothetical protein HY731_10045 [Candidatus Tectomicrobia bacterium]|nr:hypothetical protein [Candidatus Tectomicrobia bacterium]
MLKRTLRWILIAHLTLVLNVGQQVTAAQPATTASPEKSAPPQSQSEARVQGFRSAHFRMTEAETRKAIQTDFQMTKDAIMREVNPLEKTFNLSITVPDLIPDSGPARVVYLFDSKLKQLIQVTLSWGKPVNPNPDASSLVATATLLRDYFAEQGFRKESITVNGRLEDGTFVVFRATDRAGNMVLLLLNILPENSSDAKTSETQEKAASVQIPSLQLSYIQNVRAADMFRIEK